MAGEAGVYDLAIIGGGINGVGIARDATGRGLKVILAEQGDLASGTSSASTKLIHGGLRYLEHYEFRLVREALIEREVLLNAAPHIIWPLRFVLPHHKGLRPWPVLRLGLFLYDHLGGRQILPGTRGVDLTNDVTGAPLKSEFTRGFEYSDCWVNDARLVVLTARDAQERGADIRPRTRCVSARRDGNMWTCVLEDANNGAKAEIKARLLINTGGPWVSQVLGAVIGENNPDKIRMVKGSHIVVDKLYDHDRCYIFQNTDGRICFAIPYEQNFTLIGTTDEDHKGDPGKPEISQAERDYLLASVSEYFKKPVTADMVRWTYSGIRPLYDDGASKAQEATREYVLKLDASAGQAPLLSVFGGKITTFRKLAEAVLDKIGPFFAGLKPSWTATAALPGGDFPFAEVEKRIADFQRRHAFLAPSNARRIFRAYGTRADRIFEGVRSPQDVGESFGLLSAREVNYLVKEEWADTPEDILWRRSKLGLHLSVAEQSALQAYMTREAGDKTRRRASAL
ncbi:glycerol-3-phosphate dehydrogenase [Nordella sp. HKS 07]|uniref:glycerol-3-phosphate dehydrogenase n=1 Tax=Nordella sp. HKS 07 TaxID=2712222 RepID=UPI0013E124B8|nr:glycerol-3-phosphate dehydrogenase [Nordella sp. HKS 07]QIG47264.1 glycerol-3-phosphate dehydrogenase [Nordella sp. HKS 07]